MQKKKKKSFEPDDQRVKALQRRGQLFNSKNNTCTITLKIPFKDNMILRENKKQIFKEKTKIWAIRLKSQFVSFGYYNFSKANSKTTKCSKAF